MSKKSVAITGVAALVAGIVIGSSGSAESNTPAAAPKPQVKVQTVTKTRTVHDRVEVVPASCLKTIHASEKVIAGLMPDAMDIMVGYIGLIQDAAEAGAAQDVDGLYDVRDQMQDLSDDTAGITRQLRPLGRKFRVNRDACEAAAS